MQNYNTIHNYSRLRWHPLRDGRGRVRGEAVPQRRHLHRRDQQLPLQLHQRLHRQELRDQRQRVRRQPLLQRRHLQGLIPLLQLRLPSGILRWVYIQA